MQKIIVSTLFLLGLSVSSSPVLSSEGLYKPVSGDFTWAEKDKQGETKLHLYVYWSVNCPHCKKALPFVKRLGKQYSWLDIHLKEVAKDQQNLEDLYLMADALEEPTSGQVPAFFFCGLMYTGYSDDSTTGQWIDETLLDCRKQMAETLN